MSPGGGGAGGTLANLVVQFTLQGKEELQKSIADVQNQNAALGNAFQASALKMQVSVQTVTKSIQDTQSQTQKTLTQVSVSINALADNTAKQNAKMQGAMKDTAEKTKDAAKQAVNLGEAFAKAANVINLALGAGVATIGGFVRQGLAMGAMGQVLSFQMERLALTITGLFRPEIQKGTELVSRFTDWINHLSDAQKAMIARLVEGAAAFGVVNLILPRLVGGIGAVIGAVKALTVAVMTGSIASGIGAILPILGTIASAMTFLLVGTERGRALLGRVAAALKPILDLVSELAAKYSHEINDAIDATVGALALIVEGTVEIVHWTAKWVERLNMALGVMEKMAEKAVLLRGVLAVALGPFGIVFDELRKIGAGLGGGKHGSRGMESRRTGGFEDLKHTYERIALASLRATSGARSPEERTATATEAMANAGLPALRAAIEHLHLSPYTA